MRSGRLCPPGRVTRSSRIVIVAGALALLAGTAACDHTTPFAGEIEPNPPPGAGPVYRVTMNTADDRTATWVPDGSGFIYSTERTDRPDADRCLAVQPAAGGSIGQLACQRRATSDDSTDVWESPAVNTLGHLIYVHVRSGVGRPSRAGAGVVLAPLADPARGTTVVSLPYVGPDGRSHANAAELAWVSPERFVYVAQRVIQQGSPVQPDTFYTGLAVMEVTLGGTPVRRLVPGTEWASSVAAGDDEDTIYYTLGGDSRVFSQSLSTGTVAVVHDFAAGIARGIDVRGRRLAAIVGGSVLFQFEDAYEMVQRDEGGALHLVDLDTGAETVLAAAGDSLFHRPAIAPDGSRLVAEAAIFAPVHVGPATAFNATNHRHDLWLFTLP